MNSTKTEKCQKLDNGVSEAKDKENKNHDNIHDSDSAKGDLVNINDSMSIESNSSEIYKSLVTLNSKLNTSFNVQNFENVTELNLTNNNLNMIPKTIIKLSALETLILDHNNIIQLPQIMKEMIHIKQLSLASNGLTQFPLTIGYLKNIEVLNVSNNVLQILPDSFKQLKNLQILNISRNRFDHIPKCIQTGLPKLRILDVSENNKMNLKGRISSTNLRKFYARNNGLVPALFPRWIFYSEITEYDEINFENTCFEVITIREARKKVKIKKLNLNQNYLNDDLLLTILKNIDSVNYLSIENTSSRYHQNTFTEFPKKFNNPQNVIELKINRVGLSKILNTIETFSNLIKLEIQYNSLNWLPDEIVNLKRLENLIINNNSLVMLPENLGQMISLKVLSGSYNNITLLPESIRYLKNIEFIDLYSNLINKLPRDIHNLKSLKGLDLEQNLINTNDFKLPASYDNLRNQLGDDNNDLKLRNVGPQIFQLTSDESLTSSYSSDDHNYQSSRCSTNHSSNSSQTQNDWNTEYDSSDEFDPFHIPIVPKIPPLRNTMHNKMEFCPADLHPRRIQDILTEKYARGEFVLPPFPVEGQFDDVE